MKAAITLACLLACSFAHAATIELANPTARQIVGVQCGTPNQIPIAAGFSQDGNYAVAVVYGWDTCNGSGRAARVSRYYGCAVVRWDLSGLMIDVAKFPMAADMTCPTPANTLYAPPPGYVDSIAPNAWNVLHVFLVTP